MALTVKSVITMAGRLRDHAFGDEVALVWLNEAEGLVQTEVMLRAIEDVTVYDTVDDTQTLVQMPHGKLYYQYIVAKICEANGDYDEYANWQAQFERSLSEFQTWFCAMYRPMDHEPVYTGSLIGRPWRGYFISAYGLAVKHGFQGDEAAWLQSLVGETGPGAMLRYNPETEDIEWAPAGSEEWQGLFSLDMLIDEVNAALLEDLERAVDEAKLMASRAEDAAARAAEEAKKAAASGGSGGGVKAEVVVVDGVQVVTAAAGAVTVTVVDGIQTVA